MKQKDYNIKVLVAGEGGQGVQTVAKVLARTAFDKNIYSIYVPNFGVEQRGGVSIAFLQLSDSFIFYPKFDKADILVVLSARAVDRVKNYVDNNTKIIFNNTLVKKTGCNACKEIGIDATAIAINDFTYQALNMIILGSLVKSIEEWFGLTFENLDESINKQLGHKFKQRPELKKMNFEALERGKSLI